MMSRATVNFAVDLLSLWVMLALAATGGLLHLVLPPGTGQKLVLFGLGRHDFGRIHWYLALAALALLALHILLHWGWVCCFAAKSLGAAAPSRTGQVVWGLGVLVGALGLLGGSLIWCSSCVQHTEGGSERGAHREHEPEGVPQQSPGPVQTGSGVSEPGKGAGAPAQSSTVESEGDGSHAASKLGESTKHLEDCKAGAAISGRMPLATAAQLCGLDVSAMRKRFHLPESVGADQPLGHLRREYGLSIHDVRILACQQ